MLLPTTLKVLTKIVLNRIADKLEPLIRKQQTGFYPNRSCVDHINTLRVIFEQSAHLRAALQLVVVDSSTAIDSISGESIWNDLLQRNVFLKLIRLIQAQYNDFKFKVL